jgi:SAM-dependent methyltransferase
MAHNSFAMPTAFKNLLYDHPEFYEVLYPEPNDETPAMCRRMFERYLSAPPASVLDIGCGTGRDLRSLHRTYPYCVGIDLLPNVIEYARSQAKDIEFRVGNMRDIRLGRTFDAVICFGSALLYALTNEDIDKTLATFAAHSHAGSLLILDVRNASALLGDGFKVRIEGDVRSSLLSAHYVVEHSLNRRKQLLIRKRTWNMPDATTAEDYCEYRLLFPQEIEQRLSTVGFRVLGMFDNHNLRETDFTGPTIYIAAKYVGR